MSKYRPIQEDTVTGSEVGLDDVQTLTNKTIDGDDNTLQDLGYDTIKSDSRSGSDATLITGTAGTDGSTGKWNSDGDLVDGFAPTGSDATLVSGTAGTTNYTSKWNADGDLVDGYEVLDEDAMGSDSDTKLATQQSIKAYVDTEVASGLSFPILTWNETFSNTFADFDTRYTTTTGDNSTITINANGLVFTNATGATTSECSAEMCMGRPDSQAFNWFTKDLCFSFGLAATSGVDAQANAQNEAYVYISDNATAFSGIDAWRGTTNEYMGISRIRDDSSAETWYFVTSDNTTNEESTDITASVAALGKGTYSIVLDPDTSVKLYYEGSLVTTHSTRVPAGDNTWSNVRTNIVAGTDCNGSANVSDAKSLYLSDISLLIAS